MLGWSQQELARQAELGVVTVNQVESGITKPRRATMAVIKVALEATGIESITEKGGGQACG